MSAGLRTDFCASRLRSIALAIHCLLGSVESGPANMAMDQALLEFAGETGQAWLRWYGWDEPTLSLGYFQLLQDRARHPDSQTCAVVRRASGGGAILHHHELTYALALPNKLAPSLTTSKLYHRVHQVLIAGFAQQGISLMRYADQAPSEPSPRLSEASDNDVNLQPFLCFQRRTAEDLLFGEHKVVGSAQRQTPKARLIHGSILLKQSPFARELPGINELSGKECAGWELAADFTTRLACQLELSIVMTAELPAEVYQQARHWEESRFANRGWLERR